MRSNRNDFFGIYCNFKTHSVERIGSLVPVNHLGYVQGAWRALMALLGHRSFCHKMLWKPGNGLHHLPWAPVLLSVSEASEEPFLPMDGGSVQGPLSSSKSHDHALAFDNHCNCQPKSSLYPACSRRLVWNKMSLSTWVLLQTWEETSTFNVALNSCSFNIMLNFALILNPIAFPIWNGKCDQKWLWNKTWKQSN